MNQETKNCQNCKNDFVIEINDFSFYEKIKVPPPTFCPPCRRQRRFMWRNERTLYHRTCGLCNKNILAIYHKSSPFPVYCHECWYGDKWDRFSYGKDYDFTRPFFEQYKEFSNTVPRVAKFHRNAQLSEYAHTIVESKNAYLSFSITKNSENIFYSKCIDSSRDIVDSMNIINNSESLYENVEGQGNYNSQYLLLCRNSIDSYYSVDCVDCNDVFLCNNLRNKKFCIRNVQYTKEDYFKELEKFNLKSRASREALLKEFEKIKINAIYRFANINRCVDVTGNNLLDVKNSKFCFEIYNSENLKYCFRAIDLKDSMDFNYGLKSELMYEYDTGCLNDYNVKFSHCATSAVRDADYTEWCVNSSNLFGCVGLKDTQNAIFNKVYSEEEFKKLREKIILQMNTMPYISKRGHTYRYGEFFPEEISPWAYNETLAQETNFLTKDEAIKNGYNWLEPDLRDLKITLETKNIPDNIDDVNESILNEIISCSHGGKCNHQCTEAFKITDFELKFYKKHNVPLPIFCPNCRYYERSKVMPGLDLYKRICMCDKKHTHHEGKCDVEFETAYAPERPEKVYCEKCYQQEVY